VAVGDSITQGYGDDYPMDDVSSDGRNSGGGYTPILNDLLTSVAGTPHNIANEGVPGITSAEGLAAIDTVLDEYPEAQRYLVLFGTNDARPWLPVPPGPGPGSFQDNMQQIIDKINAKGKEVCLAKLPIVLADGLDETPYPDPEAPPDGSRGDFAIQYNAVINQLAGVPGNNIAIVADLYGLFTQDVPGGKRYEFEYADMLHPNGTGYSSMADEWFDAL